MTLAKQYSVPQPKAPDKEPSWFVVVMLSGVISGLLLFAMGWYLSLPEAQRGAVFNKILSASDVFPGLIGLNQSKTLLVMGVDMPPLGSHNDYSGVRTDTMMLVRMDTHQKKVNIVSIPRDSKVYIADGHGVNKINAAFPFGGPDLAVKTVEQAFGVHVDNYLVINLRGVREVVDALGGIDIYVEKPMHYKDHTAGLYINLSPGLQHLNGREAEGFLRFRHDALGDIGRIRRQQQFISGISARLKDPTILFRLKPLLNASSQYLMTNMSTQDLISLVLFGKDLNRSNFQVATLPGHPSLSSQISYWLVDPQPAEAVLNRLIIGANYGSQEGLLSGQHPTVGLLYTPDHALELSDFKVHLGKLGFTVICKAPIARSNTRLISHNQNLGADTDRLLQQSSPELKDAQLIFFPHGATFETNACGRSDYTVILGQDTRSTEIR